MTDTNQKQLVTTLWSIANQLRGAVEAVGLREYVLSFLFLLCISNNCHPSVAR